MLSQIEAPFLIFANALYLSAMLLFWVGLFLWPKREDEEKARKNPGDFARFFLWGGALFHLVSIAGQGPKLFTANTGVAGLFGWLLVVAFLIVGRKLGMGSGSVVAPVALCAALYSLLAPEIHTYTPASQLGAWFLAAHVFIILSGYVALAFAFAASLLYIVQEDLLKKKRLHGLWRKLPSLGVSDEWIFRATSFGLALLTLGLLTSIVYAFTIKPDYRALQDPKVIFSGATWMVFALYLASRLWLGWHGRRSSFVVIGGFVLMAVSFFGVGHSVSSP